MKYVIREQDGRVWTTTSTAIAEEQTAEPNTRVTAKNF